MNIKFASYDEFRNVLKIYVTHQCSDCKIGILELSEVSMDVDIEKRFIHVDRLLILSCTNCGKIFLPEQSKRIINSIYKRMVEENQFMWFTQYSGKRKKFNYCIDQDFVYDDRDYYNIPGLCYDEEHDIEGFLTPVYFDIKVLLYFFHDPDYKVNLASETYGELSYKDEWVENFGINRNGNVVFWLGDLDYIDKQTLNIMKPHNINSDHQLTDSEFFAGQMCCEWSEPNKELRVCYKKTKLFKSLIRQYGISLFHLDEEIKKQMEVFNKPVVFSEKSIEPAINMLNKVLIEGVDINNFRILASKITNKDVVEFEGLMSIKLFELLLQQVLSDENDLRHKMSPLYILNDIRQYYDHLLSVEAWEKIQKNIEQTTKGITFTQTKDFYDYLINGINSLFDYLNIGYATKSEK